MTIYDGLDMEYSEFYRYMHLYHIYGKRMRDPPQWVRYVAFALETCPETGRFHFQAFCVTWDAVRFTQFKSWIGTNHVESMRGTFVQNEAYCAKKDTLESFGDLPMQGRRTDLIITKRRLDSAGASENVFDIAREERYFEPVIKYAKNLQAYLNNNRLRDMYDVGYIKKSVHVFTGPPHANKSRSVRDLHGSANVYSMPDNKLQWGGSYSGQSVVLFDDVHSGNTMSITDFLRYTDGYPLEVPIKGGFCPWTPKHIYFTTNAENIADWWPNADHSHIMAAKRRITEVRAFDPI